MAYKFYVEHSCPMARLQATVDDLASLPKRQPLGLTYMVLEAAVRDGINCNDGTGGDGGGGGGGSGRPVRGQPWPRGNL